MNERKEQNMVIRQEKPKDYEEIYTLVKTAFDSAEHADGNEQDLVNALRKSEAYIQELALVAEEEGKLLGHILFTKAELAGKTVLALAPVSVLPEYQRMGIGTALIDEGHKIAASLGYEYVVVLGSENYYPRHGYVPAETYGIYPPFAVASENFMARKLREDAAAVTGVLKYAKEFGVNSDDENA